MHLCVDLCTLFLCPQRPKYQIPWRQNYRQLWAPWCGCLIQFKSLEEQYMWLTTELSLELLNLPNLTFTQTQSDNVTSTLVGAACPLSWHPLPLSLYFCPLIPNFASWLCILKKGSLLIPLLPHLNLLLALPPPLTFLPPYFLLLNPVLGVIPKTLQMLDRCTATELILSPVLNFSFLLTYLLIYFYPSGLRV